jgi:SAM-dependent methyltransferase
MENIDINVAINNNAIWVRRYEVANEVKTLTEVLTKLHVDDKALSVVDVGCGNGRSLELLKKVLDDKSKIIGIDKQKENITYCNYKLQDNRLKLEWINAVDFFSLKENESRFDLILFSWSLFDMFNESDTSVKYHKLSSLLDTAKNCLKKEGIIIVLQPTKGGLFEQLLSKFLPGSDDDYKLVHDFLLKNNFCGAKNAFPKVNDQWAIWSEFKYSTIEDIYRGVASILYLEQRELLTQNQFYVIWEEFCKEHCHYPDENLKLTDCVNLYYRA